MVAEPHTPTKAQLLDALRASRDDALARLRALPPEEFERGRYENGWNGRQILAHIASIEWTYPRLLDVAKEAPAAAPAPAQISRTEPGEAPAGTPTRIAQGGIDSYNDRQVARRAEASVAELLDEFARNRDATIAAVEAADEALFARPIRSAGGITGALAGVINAVAVQHVHGHVADLCGAELTGQRW
ncbi:MAG: DinB family protein [Chloroflexi bacterium]|nr:DinB family protein [Chloroflexota bacterium]